MSLMFGPSGNTPVTGTSMSVVRGLTDVNIWGNRYSAPNVNELGNASKAW
jgi:hypothetical protein